MHSCKNKSKKLLLFCIIMTFMCLAVACRSNNNDKLNSGDMAGTGTTKETPSPSPAPTPTPSPTPTPDVNMNNDITTPLPEHNLNGDIVNDNGGIIDNVGNAAGDIIDGVGNAANDLLGDPTPLPNTNDNVNSVTNGTR